MVTNPSNIRDQLLSPRSPRLRVRLLLHGHDSGVRSFHNNESNGNDARKSCPFATVATVAVKPLDPSSVPSVVNICVICAICG